MLVFESFTIQAGGIPLLNADVALFYDTGGSIARYLYGRRMLMLMEWMRFLFYEQFVL